LKKKTPIELAANDSIKELMIVYCSPEYMTVDDYKPLKDVLKDRKKKEKGAGKT